MTLSARISALASAIGGILKGHDDRLVALEAAVAALQGAGSTPAISLSLTLPGTGTVGTAFSGQATATNTGGATGTLSYSASGLPDGVTINTATGEISGTPTTEGATSVTVTATNGTQSASKSGTVTIAAASQTPAVQVSASLPDAIVGVAYTGSVTGTNVNGATGTMTYSVDTLPGGLSLNSSTGAVTGTPTTEGSVDSTFTVSNGTQSATLGHSFAVLPTGSYGNIGAIQPGDIWNPPSDGAGPPPPSISVSATMPNGTQGESYAGSVSATNQNGATGTISYSATGLPDGLTLDTGTGAVTGTPTVYGPQSVTFTATNGTQSASVTKAFTLAVAQVPAISMAQDLPQPRVGVAYTGSVTGTNVNGASGTITYTVDQLPAGLSLNAATGGVTGTPTTEGDVASVFTATNGTQSSTVNNTFSVAAAAGADPVVLSSTWATPVTPGIFEEGPFTSKPFDAVAGSLIIVGIYQSRYNDRPVTAVTDTAGNTYVKGAPLVSSDGTQAIVPWYCLASAAKVGNVVSIANTGGSLNYKGFRIVQVSTPAGKTWATDGAGSGIDDSAVYTNTATTAAMDTTGKGLVYIFGRGDQSQAPSAWALNPCSNPLGGVGGTDVTTEEAGVDGIDFTSAAQTGRTTTATISSNTHPMVAQFPFKLV